MPITAHYSQKRNECITCTFAILPNYILLHALKRRRKLSKRIMSFDILFFPLDSCVVCCQDCTHFFSYERLISFAQTNRIINTLYNWIGRWPGRQEKRYNNKNISKNKVVYGQLYRRCSVTNISRQKYIIFITLCSVMQYTKQKFFAFHNFQPQVHMRKDSIKECILNLRNAFY